MAGHPLDLPAADPLAQGFNKPPARRGRPPKEAQEPPPPPQNVTDAKNKVLELTEKLDEATAETLPDMLQQIQVARVKWVLLEELHSGIADPQTLRELSSLNKLVTGKELGGDPTDPENEAVARAARTREYLTSRGLTSEGAARAIRILDSMGAADARQPSEPPVQ